MHVLYNYHTINVLTLIIRFFFYYYYCETLNNVRGEIAGLSKLVLSKITFYVIEKKSINYGNLSSSPAIFDGLG